VWQHRLLLDAEAEFAGTSSQTVVARVLEAIAAPQARTAA
jgi:MoxR-like ATPase